MLLSRAGCVHSRVSPLQDSDGDPLAHVVDRCGFLNFTLSMHCEVEELQYQVYELNMRMKELKAERKQMERELTRVKATNARLESGMLICYLDLRASANNDLLEKILNVSHTRNACRNLSHLASV